MKRLIIALSTITILTLGCSPAVTPQPTSTVTQQPPTALPAPTPLIIYVTPAPTAPPTAQPTQKVTSIQDFLTNEITFYNKVTDALDLEAEPGINELGKLGRERLKYLNSITPQECYRPLYEQEFVIAEAMIDIYAWYHDNSRSTDEPVFDRLISAIDRGTDLLDDTTCEYNGLVTGGEAQHEMAGLPPGDRAIC